jgi:cation diffusion facilitator family transporter
MSGAGDSPTSILLALGANFLIAVAKTAGALHTGSTSMLAEAIHSFADCANQGLLLWGLREGRKPADADHPLGHGKAVYFWSFIVALMLFSMGGVFSIYEGARKWSEPRPVDNAWVAIAILVFGLVAESVSLWGCLREVNKERGQRGLWRWFRESRRSELLVVLAEDVAALCGLALALVFIGVALATGHGAWDAAGSICIGVLLVAVAAVVAVEIKSLLIGQGVEARVLARMRSHLAEQAEVEHVYDLRTQQMGGDVMVAVKAKMSRADSALALVEAINRVEQRFRASFPEVRWLFFEPDIAD